MLNMWLYLAHSVQLEVAGAAVVCHKDLGLLRSVSMALSSTCFTHFHYWSPTCINCQSCYPMLEPLLLGLCQSQNCCHSNGSSSGSNKEYTAGVRAATATACSMPELELLLVPQLHALDWNHPLFQIESNSPGAP